MPTRITWRRAKTRRPEFKGLVGGVTLFQIWQEPADKRWSLLSDLGNFPVEKRTFDTEAEARDKCERTLSYFVQTIGAKFVTRVLTWSPTKEVDGQFFTDGYVGDMVYFTLRTLNGFGGPVWLDAKIKKYGPGVECASWGNAKKLAAERLNPTTEKES